VKTKKIPAYLVRSATSRGSRKAVYVIDREGCRLVLATEPRASAVRARAWGRGRVA
jgi:hypothetical protein